MRSNAIVAGVIVAATCGGLKGRAGECQPDRFQNFISDRQIEHLAVHGDTVWIGSGFGGVSRFDATTGAFTHYARVADGLADNFINDIAVGPNGVVWAATNFGVSFFNPSAAIPQWITFDSSNSPLNNDFVTAVAVDSNNAAWIGTFEDGLFVFDGANWQNFTPGNSGLSDQFVTSIAFGLDDAAWIGVWGDGVDRFDGKTWTNFDPFSTGTPSGCSNLLQMPPENLGLISSFVWVLGVNPVNGDVWFQNDDDGFCQLNGITVFDGQDWRTYTTGNSALPNPRVVDVGFDDTGTPFFSTLNALSPFENDVFGSIPVSSGASEGLGSDIYTSSVTGLTRIRQQRIHALPSSTLPEPSVHDIAIGTGVDPQVWAATAGGAALREPDGWETFNTDNSGIVSNDVRSIELDDNGTLYVGTAVSGLSILDNKGWRTLTTDDGLPSNWVRVSALDQNGDLWVGSELLAGLAKYDGETVTPMNTGLSSQNVYAIEVAPDGAVWVGTNGGAARFVGAQRTTFTMADGLPSNQIRAIGFDTAGNVWFGTNNAGASRYDGLSFTNFSTPEGLPGTRALAIAGDPAGRVWAGFQNESLAVYDGASWTPVARDDGLVSNRIQSILARPDGKLWVGTEQGISVIAGPSAALGDMNCDGTVSVGDINPFVLALTDPQSYCGTFADCTALNGDFTSDGELSVGDINGFVDALTAE